MRRPSHSTVVAYIALFLALGGTTMAATQLGRNTVGTKQLKKNSVTGAKVKANSLTGSDIDESTLAAVPTAKEATHAAQADNAVTLGGVSAGQLADASKLRCPVGMALAGGACVEVAERAKSPLLAAAKTCRVDGRRLPTQGELIVFMSQNFASPPVPNWVDPEYFDGSIFRGMVASTAAGAPVTLISPTAEEEYPYRCATLPSS